MQKFNLRGQSSLALMIVISLVTVSVSFAVGSVAYNQYRAIRGSINESQAFLMADSGAEIALLELYRDTEYPGGTINTPETSIDINLTDIGGDQYELSSITTVSGARRQINILLDIVETISTTGHALTTVSVYAGDDVRLQGDDALMVGDLRTNDGIEVWNNAILQGDAYGRSGVTRIYNGAQVVDNPNTGGVVEGNVYSIETANIFNSSYIQGDVVSATGISTGNGAIIDGDQTIDPNLEVEAVPVPSFDFAAAEAIAVAEGKYFDFAWQFYNYIDLNDLNDVGGNDVYQLDGMYYIGSAETIKFDSSDEYDITGTVVSEDGDIDIATKGEYYRHNQKNNFPLLVAGDDIIMTNAKNTCEIDFYGVVFAVGSADFDHTNYNQAERDQGTIIDGAAWAGDEVRIKDRVMLKLNETYTSTVQGFDFSIETGGWYNLDWEYRSAITVPADQVAGTSDHVDFPMLVNVTMPDLAASAQSDGDDILFTGADGTTKLNHEIEYYDSASGSLIAWVRVPALSPTQDNFFYMYYGNALAANQEQVEATWSSDYVMVHHLQETTSGPTDIIDSTSNNNDSVDVNFGGAGSNVAALGKIGGGVRMDGNDDNIQIADHPSQYLPGGEHTLQGWVNFDSTSGSGLRQIFAKNHTASPWEAYTFGLGRGSEELFMTEYNGAGAYIYSANYYPITTGTWYQFSAVKYADGKMEVHINGDNTNIDNVTFTGSEVDGDGRLYIGSYDGTQDFFHGYLDELRLVNKARSTEWLQTEYQNQNAPLTFMTVEGALSYDTSKSISYSLRSWSVE